MKAAALGRPSLQATAQTSSLLLLPLVQPAKLSQFLADCTFRRGNWAISVVSASPARESYSSGEFAADTGEWRKLT